MPFRFRVSAAVLAVGLGLSACTKSEIQTVQRSPSDRDGFAYGQILDHKSNCSSSKWEASKDAHDRPVVTYQCEIHVDASVGARLASPVLDSIKSAYEMRSNQRDYNNHDEYKASIAHLDQQMSEPDTVGHASIVAALQAAGDKNAALEQQTGALYDACTNALDQRRQARLQGVTEAYARIHSLTEKLSFTVGEQGIVEKSLAIDSNSGAIPIDNATAAFLVLRMQNPDDRGPETELLEEILRRQLPLQQDDLAFCGHADEAASLRSQGIKAIQEANAAVITLRASETAAMPDNQ